MRHILWGGMMIFSTACSPQGAVIFGQYDARDIFSDRRVAALCIAAAQGDIAKIDKLVKEGVDVNTRGKEGLTPLYWPLDANNLAGFQRLLEHGADPYVPVKEFPAVVSAAAQAEDTAYFKLILERGGDADWTDPYEKDPLVMQVVGYRSSEETKMLIEMLVARGANIDVQGRSGDNALIRAAGYSDFKTILFLLELGADYSLKDNAGNTVVDIIEEYCFPCKPSNEACLKTIEFFKARGIEIHWKLQR